MLSLSSFVKDFILTPRHAWEKYPPSKRIFSTSDVFTRPEAVSLFTLSTFVSDLSPGASRGRQTPRHVTILPKALQGKDEIDGFGENKMQGEL
jgi:hypothetical protein